MKQSIPHPFKAGARFQTLEDLRRAVVDLEATAREYGVTAGEVLFSDEFLLQLNSQDYDGHIGLNAVISIAPPSRKDDM